ncbi:hypothetical protein QLX08_004891 [Tetragonisca angustula]|uniref:Uncharacterized protein n=1 Tax=Tetragonisca angustula TaxID=166442 RepID=A0AAW1A0G9_9HYME
MTSLINSPFRLGGRGGAGYWGGVKGGGCGDTRAGEEVVEPWMEGTAGISVVVSGVVDVIVVVAAVGVNGDVVVVAMMVVRCPMYLEAVLLGLLLNGQGGRRGGSTGGGS